MIRRRSPYNFDQYNEENNIVIGEDYKGQKSMTVPDETMTLRQLIQRHRSGQYVPVLDAQYDESKEMFEKSYPDVSKLSKIELTELNHNLKNFITDERKRVQDYVNQQRRKAANNENGEETAPEAAEAPATT